MIINYLYTYKMRRFIYLLVGALMAIGLVSCHQSKPKGQLAQGAMLYVNVKNFPTKAMNIETRTLPLIEGDLQPVFTPLEIVKDAGGFRMDTEDNIIDGNLGILDEQKDFDNERIKMWGEQIIEKDGSLNTYFINARNIRIIGTIKPYESDPIIAYIPNATMEQASKEIRIAYDAGDYDKVYEIFHRAYTAIPCTTKQWEKLREKGEQ